MPCIQSSLAWKADKLLRWHIFRQKSQAQCMPDVVACHQPAALLRGRRLSVPAARACPSWREWLPYEEASALAACVAISVQGAFCEKSFSAQRVFGALCGSLRPHIRTGSVSAGGVPSSIILAKSSMSKCTAFYLTNVSPC